MCVFYRLNVPSLSARAEFLQSLSAFREKKHQFRQFLTKLVPESICLLFRQSKKLLIFGKNIVTLK